MAVLPFVNSGQLVHESVIFSVLLFIFEICHKEVGESYKGQGSHLSGEQGRSDEGLGSTPGAVTTKVHEEDETASHLSCLTRVPLGMEWELEESV